MDLYEEIIYSILKSQKIKITFPEITMDPVKLAELECYKALNRIKAVIDDDSLDDKACFLKIEEIIRIFQDLGSETARHRLK